ncbi:MAG: ABC transporter ATP-binding protein [Saprospiraceae bacterium]|nr:ABC transporter ATP-binding protein [Saprospiraceae bacterium]
MNSTTSVISVEGLNFGYTSKIPILKQLNLSVPQSSIYGFLGANGAGKSTTIRSILGLLKPQSGNIQIFGQEVRSNRLEILKKVGSLIESPSFYKHLSAYDNLKISCKYLNVPFSRIDEVLELVNLTKHSKRISREYSTGMKQRLGLAMALLSDPELLILDEPTSGLDPTGIIEFRNILTNLNQAGKTIFLSSHLLSEIEKIASQVGIIKNGVLLFQGTIEELEKFRKSGLSIHIVSPDTAKAAETLADRYDTKIIGTDSLEIVLNDRESIPKIIEEFVAKGIRLYEVSPQKDDLEKLFINLTTAE